MSRKAKIFPPIIALALCLLTSACSGTSGPWDYPLGYSEAGIHGAVIEGVKD